MARSPPSVALPAAAGASFPAVGVGDGVGRPNPRIMLMPPESRLMGFRELPKFRIDSTRGGALAGENADPAAGDDDRVAVASLPPSSPLTAFLLLLALRALSALWSLTAFLPPTSESILSSLAEPDRALVALLGAAAAEPSTEVSSSGGGVPMSFRASSRVRGTISSFPSAVVSRSFPSKNL